MNEVNLIGFIENRPNLQEDLSAKRQLGVERNMCDFRVIVDNEKAITLTQKTVINCRAYGDVADYIYRNCFRGTLIELTGSLGSLEYKTKSTKETRYLNYVEVEKARCLVKREVVLEEFDSYIKKYSRASLKEKVKAKIKEEKKKAKEMESDVENGD